MSTHPPAQVGGPRRAVAAIVLICAIVSSLLATPSPPAQAAIYCGTVQSPEPCDPPEPVEDNGGTAVPSQPNPGPVPTMLSAARMQARELDDPTEIPQDLSDFDLGNLETVLDSGQDPWYEQFTPPAWPLLWSTAFAQRQLKLKYSGASLQPDGVGKAIFYKSPAGGLRPDYPYKAMLVPAEGEPTYPTVGVPYRFFLVTDYQPSTPSAGRNATIDWGDETKESVELAGTQVGYFLPGIVNNQKVLQLHTARVIRLEHTYGDPKHVGSYWARPTITIEDDSYTEVEYTSTMSDSQRQILQYFGSGCDAALKVISIYLAVGGAVDPYSSLGADIVGTATGMTQQQIANLAQVLNTYGLYSTGSSIAEDMLGMYSSGGMCTNVSAFVADKIFGVGFQAQEHQYKPTFVLRSAIGQQPPTDDSYHFGQTLKRFGGSPDGGIRVHAPGGSGADPFARPGEFSSADPNHDALRLAQKRYSDIKTGTPYFGMWDDDTVVVESIWADMQQHPLPPLDQSQNEEFFTTRVEDISRSSGKICPGDTVRAVRGIAGSRSGVRATWMGPEGEDIGAGTSQPVDQAITVPGSLPRVAAALRAGVPGPHSVTFSALSPDGTRHESGSAYFVVEDPGSQDCGARTVDGWQQWSLDLRYDTASVPLLGVDAFNVTATPKLRRDVQLQVCKLLEPLPPKVDPDDPDPPARECLIWGTEDHSYEVPVSSLEGSISFDADGELPAGFTLDARTGVLRGTIPSNEVPPVRIAAVVSDVRSASATVDLTAPSVTVDVPTSVDMGDELVATFGASDTSGIATIKATFDGVAIKSGVSVDKGLLGVGTHLVRVSATDRAGLTRVVRRTIEVLADTKGPEIWLDVPEKVVAGESFLVQYRAFDTGSGVADVKATYDDLAIPSESWIDSSRVTPGSHRITVVAVDNAANVTEETREVVVPQPDTTPPEIKVDAPERVVWPLPVVIAFEAGDAESGVDWVRATFDGHEIRSGDVVPADLAVPGDHVLSVRAADLVGNEAVMEHHIAVEDVDTMAPRIRIDIAAPMTITPSAEVVVTFDAEDDLTGVAELGGWFDSRPVESGRPLPSDLLTVGEHVVTVTARDGAGNEAVERRTLTVDTPIPPPPTADTFEFGYDGGLHAGGGGPLLSGAIATTGNASWGTGTISTQAGVTGFSLNIRWIFGALPLGSVVTTLAGSAPISTPVFFKGVSRPVCGVVSGMLSGWRWNGRAFAPYTLRFKAVDAQRTC